MYSFRMSVEYTRGNREIKLYRGAFIAARVEFSDSLRFFIDTKFIQ
jgi:hypothetical protein